jgi:hypothetical protein
VHDAHSEIVLSHSLFKFLNSLFSVAIYQSLVNVEISIKVK